MTSLAYSFSTATQTSTRSQVAQASSSLGVDVWCGENGLATGRYASGGTLVAQRLYRCLTTQRGTLRGTENHFNWGEDLAEVIGECDDGNAESKIRAAVTRACTKDEQIESFSISVSRVTDSAAAVSYEVEVDAKTAIGPFELVLSVSDVTVEILGLRGES